MLELLSRYYRTTAREIERVWHVRKKAGSIRVNQSEYNNNATVFLFSDITRHANIVTKISISVCVSARRLRA